MAGDFHVGCADEPRNTTPMCSSSVSSVPLAPGGRAKSKINNGCNCSAALISLSAMVEAGWGTKCGAQRCRREMRRALRTSSWCRAGCRIVPECRGRGPAQRGPTADSAPSGLIGQTWMRLTSTTSTHCLINAASHRLRDPDAPPVWCFLVNSCDCDDPVFAVETTLEGQRHFGGKPWPSEASLPHRAIAHKS